MKRLNQRFRILLFTAALMLLSVGMFYQFSVQQIPSKVAESQSKIMNVDALRFTFKSSLLAQKSSATLSQAIQLKNQDLYYDALDYLDASLAFLDVPYYVEVYKFDNENINQLLTEAHQLLTKYKLNMSLDDQKRFYELINKVSYLSEQRERTIWTKLQKEYADYRTDEYQRLELYQATLFVFSGFFIIGLWLLILQNRLMRENQQHQHKLYRLAYFDNLTAIPNRKSIEELLDSRIKISEREKVSFYIALIDLDDFKLVNEISSHQTGDQLLIQVADCLKETLREEIVVGRLGGDEYLIVFDEHTKESSLTTILSRIQNRIAESKIDNFNFTIRSSIGVAKYPNDLSELHKNPRNQLLKSAEIALYQAKSLGKNQFHFYNENLGQTLQQEHELDLEIHNAIVDNQFELYYQPIFDNSSQSIHHAEALVRWNHPQKGLIMPGAFIPFIEKGHHAEAFGEWVIQTVIHQQKKWLDKGLDVHVSLNLSVKHILSPDFNTRLPGLIIDLNADLSRISFEITEYELIESSHDPLATLQQLAQQGFHFHLDDFGTGYSSITYLSDLPVDTIKIDQAFTQAIGQDTTKTELLVMMIELGKILHKKIVIEGVETSEQLKFIQPHQNLLIQGYYFSNPLPVPAFEAFIATQAQKAKLL